MLAKSPDELKRKLAAHAVNLANFTSDLEKSEKLRVNFLAKGDDLQSGLAEEVSNAHHRTIAHIKELIVKDYEALVQIDTARNRPPS